MLGEKIHAIYFQLLTLILYIFSFVLGEIISQHINLTESEFDNIAAEWLRFGRQRQRREDKGKENVHQNENEEDEDEVEEQ